MESQVTKFLSKPVKNTPVLGKNGALSPWLSSVRDATGVDPREQTAGTTYLLLDTSGSMSGAPIAEAVEGARRFNAECTNSGQSVGLVCFSTAATLRAKPSRTGIIESLTNLKCSGSTNMAAALELATADLLQAGGRRTMVIATDGQPDDPDATIAAAERAKQAGIRILTIGTVGSDSAFPARLAPGSSNKGIRSRQPRSILIR